MRLGLRPTLFQPNTSWSKVKGIYGGHETIWERHRHRYEVNPQYVEKLERDGMRFTGKDQKSVRMQVAELEGAFASRISRTVLTNESPLARPPFLLRLAGASRILHPTSEPLSALPRLRRCGMRPLRPGGANRASRSRVRPASP